MHEISSKKEIIILKRYAWKTLCSSQKLLVTHGKIYYLLRKLSCHKREILCQVFKKKDKSSDIRVLWKKKKYSEENIVLIQWQTLQLLILLCKSLKSIKKRQCYRGSRTYCLLSLCYIVKFCQYWFSGQTVSVNLRDLCQIVLQ